MSNTEPIPDGTQQARAARTRWNTPAATEPRVMLSARISQSGMEALNEMCKHTGRDRSDIVREALRDYFRSHPLPRQ